ncbi:CPSF A subunit region-domain-containing protein [Lipomyces orientalis]|uniref:CPSF A subunit region-domain-containing protein n=1 Tax=Lipomyces orientalis TaxID=1233043 RepID=A0ACC3TPY1_9ASCO
MQVYQDLTPPTSVTHSVVAQFITASSPNLIVLRASKVLQIFDFVTHESQEIESVRTTELDERVGESNEDFIGDLGIEQAVTKHQTKLVLRAEYELNGFATGLEKVRTMSDLSRDFILISFETAKVSLLTWDCVRNAVTTVSLHYYEKQRVTALLNTDNAENASFLRADVSGTCACLKFGKDIFAFLPFKRDDVDDIFNAAATNDVSERKKAFYPSFVVQAARLDEDIFNVIDTTFLYEYREPTLAILYQPRRTWTGLIEQQQDTVSLIVVALDLVQRASTSILSISNLPYDIVAALALPAPIGGSLLFGANELLHVDNSGRTVGVAVNSAAFEASAFDFVDRSFLELRLEGAKGTYLQDNFVLLILATGEMYLAEFAMEGRAVEAIELHNVESSDKFVDTAASTVKVIPGRKKVFVGSENGDSVLLSWRKAGDNAIADKTDSDHAAVIKSKDYEDDDEDLYGASESGNADKGMHGTGLYGDEAPSEDAYKRFVFSVHDTLTNYGPLVDLAVGSVQKFGSDYPPDTETTSKLEVVAARGGLSQSGGLSIFRRSISASVIASFNLSDCQALWTVKAKNRNTKSINTEQLDKYLIISKADESLLFDISEQFDQVKNSEFDPKAPTVAVGSLLDGTRIVQICRTEIRVYDSDMQITQMLPLPEHDYDLNEPQIVSASFGEREILVVLQNGKGLTYIGDEETLELSEVEIFDARLKFAAGCIATIPNTYFSNLEHLEPNGTNTRKRKRDDGQSESANSEALTGIDLVVFMVTTHGDLQIYRLKDKKLVYAVSHIDALPPLIESPRLSKPLQRPGPSRRKSSAGIVPHIRLSDKEYRIAEVMYAPLGDTVDKRDYLLLRTEDNDIVMYEPFLAVERDGVVSFKLRKLPKTTVTRSHGEIAKPDSMSESPRESEAANTVHDKDSSRRQCMVALPDVNGFAAVFVSMRGSRDEDGPVAIPQHASYWILKTSKSLPKLIPFASCEINSLSPFHSLTVDRGFIYLSGKGTVRICKLFTDFAFDGTWPAKKVPMEDDVHAVTYHAARSMYVVSTSKQVPFSFKGDSEERDGDVGEPEFPAMVDQGSLVLVSPKSWIPVDAYEFEAAEVALVVKTVRLQVSENSQVRRQYVAVGTGIFFGEDLPAKGYVYIFEIIEVVPEPGKPENNHKLKLIVKEDVRGVVSTLCDVNGYLLAAQGQKVMVRALREDNSFLPVAFMDMNLYVSEAKCIKNMILMGDAMKSVWFVGFSEEPFKMQLFGKDLQRIEVVAAEFVVDGAVLHFVIADTKRKIHILQYDPEDPRSLSGQRLIRKSDFFTGHDIESFVMVPKSQFANDLTVNSDPVVKTNETNPSVARKDQYMAIACTRAGSIAAVLPVSESKYRRLVSVQQQLTDKIEHVAGLNPRMYRALSATPDLNSAASRAVLDGNLILKLESLSLERQLEVFERAGKGSEQEIRQHLIELDKALSYM